MLALIYFWCAVSVGDFFCQRFYRFVSVAHRCAAALLVGLLISSWFTYLAGLAFAWTVMPLLWANLLFTLAVLSLLSWPICFSESATTERNTELRYRSDLYLPR